MLLTVLCFALCVVFVCCAGKRTIGGLLDDGVKSIVRYYLNNFQVRLAAAEAPRGVLKHSMCPAWQLEAGHASCICTHTRGFR